jgi:amino-acid N-acetyltransferase
MRSDPRRGSVAGERMNPGAVRVVECAASPVNDPAVRALWEEAGLQAPPLDHRGRWWVVEKPAGHPIAVAGSEVYGPHALLRSVAVHGAYRGMGIGTHLIAQVLEALRAAGVRCVYLVTESAEPFFGAWGFTRVERATLPPSIAATDQLMGACPVSAAVLRLCLDGGRRGPG